MASIQEEAQEYVLNYHPTKLEIFNTCLKLEMESEHYWCYFKDGKLSEDLYEEGTSPFIGVFNKKQTGFKLADLTIPYPSEEELLEHVQELHVTGEDLKKSKWQLLAEKQINDQ